MAPGVVATREDAAPGSAPAGSLGVGGNGPLHRPASRSDAGEGRDGPSSGRPTRGVMDAT